MTQLTKSTRTPEEKELESKEAQFAALEAQLVQRELDLNTLQASLSSFEQRYLRLIGAKWAKYDEVEARIAEITQLLNPQDSAARQYAKAARSQADETAQTCSGFSGTPDTEEQPFRADDNLKALYRQVAKKVHPDLATNDSDRTKRTQIMAEANAAYRDGNTALLTELLIQWEQSPDNVQGDGVGSRLIRMIRQIAQVEARLEQVEEEIRLTEQTELYVLFKKTEEAAITGFDLLAAMAAEIDEKIQAKLHQLDTVLDEFVRRKRTL